MSDFETLLEPIRVDAPTGDNLRLSASDLTLRKIQGYRIELEPEIDPAGVGRAADWRAVARECESALRTRTKDLELAAWLAEAWTRIHGFPGLRDGIRFVSALCARFWDDLHPGVEDGALDAPSRVMPLNWLGSSKVFLRSVEGCEFAPGSVPRLSWEVHRFAEVVDAKSLLVDRRPHDELIQRGWIGSETWRERLQALGADALARLHAQLSECQAALEELLRLLEKRLGEELRLVHLVPLAGRLAEIREHVEGYLVRPVEAEPAEETGVGTVASRREPARQAAVVQASAAGGIESRDHALRILAEVAAYFERCEPHSPLAALLRRGVRWGGMSFEQILPELVRDQGALAHAWETLGIRPDRPGS